MSPAQARQWGFPFFPAFFSLFFSSFFSFFTLGVLTLPGVLPCFSSLSESLELLLLLESEERPWSC